MLLNSAPPLSVRVDHMVFVVTTSTHFAAADRIRCAGSAVCTTEKENGRLDESEKDTLSAEK